MNSLLAVLARLGLISNADVDEATAASQVTAKLGELTSAKTKAEADLADVQAKLKTSDESLVAAKKATATAIVEAAVTAGRIPGQDEKVKAKWIGLIEANAENAELLPEPNPAFKKTIQAKGAKDGVDALLNGSGEHQFLVKARAYATEHKTSEAFAVDALAHKEPALYDEYRASLNLGVPVGGKK